MKTFFALCLLLTAGRTLALDVGTQAPAFSLPGASGQVVNLAALKGRTVVLEWLNHGCPFVRKHYDSGNMQALQRKYTDKGVVWLSVVSSAPGKQGHVDVNGAKTEKAQNKSAASDILLDPTGKVGQIYGAKTTPHMYVIDKDGVLVYQGAIDSRPSTDQADVKGAVNFVAAALDATLAGRKPAQAETKAYGCGVKYQ